MRYRRSLFLAAVLTLLLGCDKGYSSGDRVLVSKFAYDSKLTNPKRFDVVVFKFPGRPVENGIPKNYIKRLWGLPGQILAIFFGRVFCWPPTDQTPPPSPFPGDKDIDPNVLWQTPHMHRDDNESRARFEQGQFEIIRKPPDIQLALRRIVYDNDYPARDLKDYPRWNPAPGSDWKPAGNTFKCDGAAKDPVDWLRYRHLLRPWSRSQIMKNRKPELITDFMDYNGAVDDPEDPRMVPQGNWVGDLMMECDVRVDTAEGEFWLELSKGINRFRARFDLASGQCTLFKVHKPTPASTEKVTELDTQPTKLKGTGSYLVRFSNIDARLTVWVDRDLPFADGKAYPPPEVRGKDEQHVDEQVIIARRGPTENDLEPASVGVIGAKVTISRLRLWRDTYYTLEGPTPDAQPEGEPERISIPEGIDPTRKDAAERKAAATARFNFLHQFWSEPSRWGPLRRLGVRTFYVQPGHFMCLGDNSPQSSDSRDWGTVPERLLLGRALMVYFPVNRAGVIR